jgi:Ca2+-binding RTX toxin-like protein
LEGGANDDNLIGNGGNDDLIGGAGNDLYGFSGAQLGSDVIYENASVDTDVLHFTAHARGININLASTAAQQVSADLTLRISSSTGIEDVAGSLFGDTIRGNSRNNRLDGNSGDDWIYGEAGDDTLNGSLGNDHVYGGAGNDTLTGMGGNDHLYGEAGLDNLDGGAGNDLLDGGLDGVVDRLTGGSGQDTFVKYRKRWNFFVDYEQNVLDYNSAVDLVITKYY